MSKKHFLIRAIGLAFLMVAAGLLVATIYVDNHLGTAYLMGLFTVSWFNATLLFSLGRQGSPSSESETSPVETIT